jgi:hypothetical protein
MVEILGPGGAAPNTGAMIGAGTGADTRGKNFFAMWCIKY